VLAGFLSPQGATTITVDGRRIARVAMRGRRTILVRLPRLKAGRHTLVARFRGTRDLAGGTVRRRIHVHGR
jgi:hypothetical protein